MKYTIERYRHPFPFFQYEEKQVMATTLLPAYGRDYKSAKAVKADWNAGKDFVICDFFDPNDGRYCNKQDMKGKTVNIRYNNKRSIVVVKG